jgi:hypothetical protein
MLGDIDRLAGKKRRAAGLDVGGAGEIEQKRKRRFVQPMFREIEQNIVERDMKALKALRIGREKIDDLMRADIAPMRLKRGESRRYFTTGHAILRQKSRSNRAVARNDRLAARKSAPWPFPARPKAGDPSATDQSLFRAAGMMRGLASGPAFWS